LYTSFQDVEVLRGGVSTNPNAPMNAPRAGHTATLLADGRVLVVGGGFSCSPSNVFATGSWQIFDPDGGTWDDGGTLNAIVSHTATPFSGGVLVAGGTTPNAAFGTPCTNVSAWPPSASSQTFVYGLVDAGQEPSAAIALELAFDPSAPKTEGSQNRVFITLNVDAGTLPSPLFLDLTSSGVDWLGTADAGPQGPTLVGPTSVSGGMAFTVQGLLAGKTSLVFPVMVIGAAGQQASTAASLWASNEPISNTAQDQFTIERWQIRAGDWGCTAAAGSPTAWVALALGAIAGRSSSRWRRRGRLSLLTAHRWRASASLEAPPRACRVPRGKPSRRTPRTPAPTEPRPGEQPTD
jgi:hypothetical protein